MTLQEELESLNYRDIQSKAKSLGLAANKKKAELILSILSRTENTSAGMIDSVRNNELVNILIDDSSLPMLEQISVEDVVTIEEVKIVDDDISPILCLDENIESNNDLIGKVSKEDIKTDINIMDTTTEVVATVGCPEIMMQYQSPVIRRSNLLYTEDEMDEKEELESTNCDDEYDYELVENGDDECTEFFIKEFTGINLNGLPTPQGIKTVFNEEEIKTDDNLKIFWG